MSLFQASRRLLAARICSQGVRTRACVQPRSYVPHHVQRNLSVSAVRCWSSDNEQNADEIALEKLKETLPPSVYARYKEKILAAKEDGRLKAAHEAAAAERAALTKIGKRAEADAANASTDEDDDDDDMEKARKSMKAQVGQDSSIKSLDSIMKLDLLENLTPKQIGDLWAEHHRNMDCVGAVIPSQLYMQIRKRANECPLFVYPLPRDEGIEFFLAQWTGNQCAFTSLVEYKMHQDNATPYLLLNNYTELVESKGIVLMAGELDPKMNTIDAHLLTNQMQIYYLGDEETFDVVRKFNFRQDEFDYNELVKRLETLNTEALQSTAVGKGE